MIVVWIGLVTVSIMLARYYKNEWPNQKLNNVALWFVLHRFMMLAAWFCSIMAVIFAYMYTETYHPVSSCDIYLHESMASDIYVYMGLTFDVPYLSII